MPMASLSVPLAQASWCALVLARGGDALAKGAQGSALVAPFATTHHPFLKELFRSFSKILEETSN